MRRRGPRPLAHALQQVAPRLAPGTTLARIQSAWPAVAGETLAAEATPVSERAGVVHLRCRAAVWAQEVELLAPELVERLNEAVADAGVRSIRASTGNA